MQVSIWHNPLSTPQRAELYVSPTEPAVIFEVPPGGTAELPSEFDAAIQTLDESGVCIGGLCPKLVRVSGPTRLNSHGRPIEHLVRDNTQPQAG